MIQGQLTLSNNIQLPELDVPTRSSGDFTQPNIGKSFQPLGDISNISDLLLFSRSSSSLTNDNDSDSDFLPNLQQSSESEEDLEITADNQNLEENELTQPEDVSCMKQKKNTQKN